MNVFGCNRLLFAYLVGKALVIAYCEPKFAAVGGVGFEHRVELLDMRLGDLVCCMIDDIIDTTEVIDCLHNIIYRGVLGCDAKRIGLEDVSRLLFGQFAAFDMVGVVGQVNLCTMVDAALEFGLFLLAQTGEQRREFLLSFLWQHGIRRDVPCFACQESTIYFPCYALIARGTFANAVLFGKLYDGNILHIGKFDSKFATKVQFFADIGKFLCQKMAFFCIFCR